MPPMRRRPAAASRSSAGPVIAVVLFVAAFAGVFGYFHLNREPEKAPEAPAAALPAFEADPLLKAGPLKVRTSGWAFAAPAPGEKQSKKIAGTIAVDATPGPEPVKGGFFGDVKFTLFSALGEKLKIDYLPFPPLKAGESAPTEIVFTHWHRVKRVWLEPTLRQNAQEK